MANEARITASLQIVADNVQYSNHPSAFLATVIGRKGPCPGAFSVPTAGVAVDFSQLTTPGLAILKNLDENNYVEYGIRDPGTNVFYPLGEIGPGEFYVIKFSRNLLEEYTGTGTGTTTTGNYFWMKANVAACDVSVEAFER